jgi:transposase
MADSVVVIRGSKDREKNKDYHSEMNSDAFYKYCNETLFPIIKGKPQKSTIFCIDRATYHRQATAYSKYPSKRGPNYMKRADLLNWMLQRKLKHPDTNTKATMPMLHDYIRKNWQEERAIDELAKKFNIILVYLPVAHPMLNPIEDIWGHIKPIVRRQNTNFSISEVERLIRASLTSRTTTEWQKIEDTKTIPNEQAYLKSSMNPTIEDEDEEDIDDDDDDMEEEEDDDDY